jgi:hypothetical protein
VRGFAVAGEPRFAHGTMQLLLIVSQMFPFDNGDHHSPHVGGPELLKKPVTKEQKVPGVFDLDLACGRNSVQCGDFKQLGTKCGGHGKSCAEIIRHRRRCDLPCVTEGKLDVIVGRTRGASQLHSGPSVLDLAGRKSESRRGGGRHVSLRRLPINHDACWRCAYVPVPGTYATGRAGAFP